MIIADGEGPGSRPTRGRLWGGKQYTKKENFNVYMKILISSTQIFTAYLTDFLGV
jgi:hypothetical protein